MPKWIPKRMWEGGEVYIIGGGPSLTHFQWDRLRGKHTIGCNDAYRLGPDFVKICFFGDASWFQKTKWDLERFRLGGPIVATCAPSLVHLKIDWLWHVGRTRDGLHPEPPIGWNFSTGAASINLAILLGAVKVYLLGFDLRNDATSGKSHWHGLRTRITAEGNFQRFLRGFRSVAQDLPKFPSVSVVNVTDGTSRLTLFPSAKFEEVFP